MNTWFSSDLHIGHVAILKYGRSALFADLDDMREQIISNWNSVVAPNDRVYLLGDAVMGPRADNLPTLDRLNGEKVLMLGNHDYPHPCNPEKVRAKWTDEYAKYASEMNLEREITVGDEKALLCHFPASGDHTEEERYTEYRPVYDGVIIHGHLHCEDIWVAPNHVHIGIDADWTYFGIERYHPIPMEAVAQAIEVAKGLS